MTAANVNKLLQDLGVEQLIKIQQSLSQETEKKREELRQMVGRRYRDVLEASNTVKRLTEIASQLVSLLAETRQSTAKKKSNVSGHSLTVTGGDLLGRREASRRLLLLHTLLPMTFTSSDLLTRAFSLCIAENLQRKLNTEQHHFANPKTAGNAENQSLAPSQILLQLLSDELLQCRIELLDALEDELGNESNWLVVSGLLAAYALLKPQSTIGQQIQLYLKARMDMVVATLRQSDSTLLGIIRQMKDTVQCVEQIAGGGHALLSALQYVTQRGWSPAPIQQLIEDQPLVYSRLLEAEIIRVNGLYSLDGDKLASNEQDVQKACSDWVVQMCSVASERVQSMCTYFERIDQAMEFALAVSQIFKSDWPTTFTNSNALIYRQLFGDALLHRFRLLIEQELRHMERHLHFRLPQINCQPQPLFHHHKRGTKEMKFDAQLASGVSAEMQELVQSVSVQLHQLQQNVQKYTQIGQEEQVGTLHDVLAEQVLAMVERLTNFDEWQLHPVSESHPTKQSSEITSTSMATAPAIDVSTSISSAENSHEQRQRWLSIFRLLLALVQHEPSVLCQCMNRNLERIVQCNRVLHTATEQALCHFMDSLLDECVRRTNFHTLMLECCSSWQSWFDLVQERERVVLSENVEVQVPTQISLHFYMFLANIGTELNQHSLGHLFTRNVSLHVARKIGTILCQSLMECAERCAPIPVICTQLLLDCKALFQMFPDKQFLDAAQLIEAKLDPIELSVLQEPLARNAKLFAQRTSMLFGQLQAEPITGFNKESQLQPSYSTLVDLMPKVNDVHRMMQIPRLSKLKEENRRSEEPVGKEKRGGTKNKMQSTLLGAPEGFGGLPGKGGAPTTSFSSLYDKISTGWFKS